jgi:hypothetical protein
MSFRIGAFGRDTIYDPGDPVNFTDTDGQNGSRQRLALGPAVARA